MQFFQGRSYCFGFCGRYYCHNLCGCHDSCECRDPYSHYKTVLYEFRCVDFIIWIPLCGFYYLYSIVCILSCGFHYVYLIECILLDVFY